MKFKPSFNKVIVKREPPKTKTEGGIVLPESAKILGTIADVLAIGPGKTYPSGVQAPQPCAVGDKVLISTQGGTTVEMDDGDCLLLEFDDILAIVEKGT